MPVGGCGSIKHWVSLDLLQTLNKPYYIYLDSDKESIEDQSKNSKLLVEYGFIEGDDFSVSRKREIENYFTAAALERIVPGCELNFTDWCDVKKLAKTSQLSGQLGGKNITSRHFNKLTFEEIQSTFNPTGDDDEFLEIYSKLAQLVDSA